MNQIVYKQFEFSWRKNLFIFFRLINESNLGPTLGLIIKQVKLKYNNMFMNKLVNTRDRIKKYNTTYLYV